MEMWILKKIQRISWADREINETVFQETHGNHKFIRGIIRRQSKLFGLVMRKNKLENFVRVGKFEAGKARRRPRSNYQDGLCTWHDQARSRDVRQ